MARRVTVPQTDARTHSFIIIHYRLREVRVLLVVVRGLRRVCTLIAWIDRAVHWIAR